MFVARKERRESMAFLHCGSSLAGVARGGEYWALLFSWSLKSTKRPSGCFSGASPVSFELFLFFPASSGRGKGAGLRGRETEIEGERREEAVLLQSRGRALKKCHLESLKE